MTPLAKRREALEARAEELESRLHDISDELETHNSADWEELAVQREEDEVLEGIGLTGQAEIRAIDAALARMDDGEYGICVRCGEAISEDRLDLLPYTPLCRNCAAAMTKPK